MYSLHVLGLFKGQNVKPICIMLYSLLHLHGYWLVVKLEAAHFLDFDFATCALLASILTTKRIKTVFVDFFNCKELCEVQSSSWNRCPLMSQWAFCYMGRKRSALRFPPVSGMGLDG